MPTEQSSEQHTKTGYSVLRVRDKTRARIDQLKQETGKITDDEMVALLIEHYIQSQGASKPQDDTRPA